MIEGVSDKVNEFYLKHPTEFVQDNLRLLGKPLNPYIYQQRVLNSMPLMEKDLTNQERVMAVCGARQIFGKSTTASMIATWYMFMHDRTNTVIISHRQRRSDKMLAKIKKYITSNPLLNAMTKKGGNADLIWSASEVELTNDSTISSLPEGNDADSAVGDTTDVVIIDEIARFKNPDSIKGAIMPTVFECDGIILFFSSSWGRGGRGEYWYEIMESDDYKLKFNVNTEECLRFQYERWIQDFGEKTAKIKLDKKTLWLKYQKRELGRYLFEMQYMNSFEYGLDSVFDKKDLKICFTNTPQLIDPIKGRRYITMVDFGKSIKTGDKTVISTYDFTDIEQIQCVNRQKYSKKYTEVLKDIKNTVLDFNSEVLGCDLGGGEKQVEDLDEDLELMQRGIKVIGVFSSGNMKHTTSDFEDKGIMRKTINKYQCATRLVSMIENHSITYCRNAMKKEYEDYLIVKTPSGLKSYKHPPKGHDDAIDTDIMLMGFLSEMGVTTNAYSVGVYSGDGDKTSMTQTKGNSVISF